MLVPAPDNGFIFFPVVDFFDNTGQSILSCASSYTVKFDWIFLLNDGLEATIFGLPNSHQLAKSPNIIGSCCKAYKFLMSYTLRWSHIYHQPYKFSKYTHILESHKTYIYIYIYIVLHLWWINHNTK